MAPEIHEHGTHELDDRELTREKKPGSS